MKKYLFIGLAVLLLAVAGLGAAGYIGKGPLAPMLHKGADEPPPPKPVPHRIVYLGEIITPIVKNHAIESQIGMDVDVDVFAEGYDKFNGLKPLIEHRVRVELYDFLPTHSDTHSAADRQAVHDRVQWIIESTVGPGIVRDVTVRSFYSR